MSDQERPAGRRGRPRLVGRREEILDAAVRVLAERGIERLSLAQLAAALGFSTYALTYHFGTKDDVLVAVAEHVETQIQAEFTEMLRQPDLTMPDLIRRYWATTQDPSAPQSIRLWLELVLLASRDPDRLPGFLDRAVQSWHDVIAPALGDRPDAEKLISLAFAAITGLELLKLITPDSDRSDQALEALIDLFQTALR